MGELGLKLGIKQVVPYLPETVTYTPKQFGSKLHGSGEGVKIAIIDSGVPDHAGILTISDDANFTESEDSRDCIGHSTIVSGIIAGNKPENVIGLAPNATLYYAKMVDDLGKVRFDAFVAAVLWGIIKEVDLIVILMTTDVHHPALQDAVAKAHGSGIAVVATATDDSGLPAYPAQYPNVCAVGEGTKLDLPRGPFWSTYIEQQYAQVAGSSVATAIAAGLAALAIERLKKSAKPYTPQDVYDLILKGA